VKVVHFSGAASRGGKKENGDSTGKRICLDQDLLEHLYLTKQMDPPNSEVNQSILVLLLLLAENKSIIFVLILDVLIGIIVLPCTISINIFTLLGFHNKIADVTF
jgi:hypothetical protein